jgi:cyclopropane fatty-acyl-phospholipid synthase-like methyltransferase
MNLRAEVPIFLKKLIWELKYGVQNRAPYSIPEDVVSHLSRLPNEARILELGCGRGSLLKGLRQAGWQGHYCGVDISAAAIRVASEIESGANSSWIVSDIESFDSNLRWDVIAMIESVYYVKIERVAEVLNRAMRMLNAGGYLLVRIHDFSKHQLYLDAIHGLGAPVEHTGPFLLIFPRQEASLQTAAN